MNYYTHVWKNYAQFSGRARRAEYWMFTLFNVIVLIVLAIPYSIGLNMIQGGSGAGWIFAAPYFIYALAAIIPSIAVGVRRLHDQNKTGWWILIGLVPIIGGLWLLILMIMEGTPGPNQYGPDPKEQAVAAAV